MLSFRSQFPFFRREIKISACSDPSFADAMNARNVLCDFMARSVKDKHPPVLLEPGEVGFFNPSATMLTLLNLVPSATAVDIPPFDNYAAFQAAIQVGHGRFLFSSDNEVLIFEDEIKCNG